MRTVLYNLLVFFNSLQDSSGFLQASALYDIDVIVTLSAVMFELSFH